MGGYIDLHTHVLAGVDDGSENVEESRRMVDAARDAGFTTIVATPHRIADVYDATDEQIDRGLAELRNSLGDTPDLALVAGAEYYLDDRFMELLDRGALRTLGDSRTVLVELPMMRLPPYAADYAFRMRLKGYLPLLAHPERYNDLVRRPKRAAELVRMGYALQVNLGSLAGIYGSRVRKTAQVLVEKGWVEAVASDIHSADRADAIYRDGPKALRKVAGDAGLERLLREQPARLLALTHGDQRTEG